MVLNEDNASPKNAGARRAITSVVTENGFSIVRLCDLEGASLSVTGKHCFIVQDAEGAEHEVTVEFSREGVELVQRRRRSLLSIESSFWINCAERSLATYLWENNHLPPKGRLLLEDISLSDLEAARRWDKD